MRLSVDFSVTSSAIIPPFSAKVSKLILHRISKTYSDLSSSRQSLKPLAVSPIYQDGRPLLKFRGDSRFLGLRPGVIYSFNFSLIDDGSTKLEDIVALENDIINNVFGTSVVLRELKIEVKRLCSLDLGKPRAIKLRFLSPVLLQLPSIWRFKRSRYVLFPIPSLMVGSLVEHWNSNCGPNLIIKRPSYTAFYANYVLMEADFEIRPVTLIYDEERRVRGFMGWVLYDLRKSRRNKTFRRIMSLLDYARYVGLGKSRAAGFGQVSVDGIY